jgi:peptidoglycan/xylan/chitin deacetylase (PgdA/CDA1 family)
MQVMALAAMSTTSSVSLEPPTGDTDETTDPAGTRLSEHISMRGGLPIWRRLGSRAGPNTGAGGSGRASSEVAHGTGRTSSIEIPASVSPSVVQRVRTHDPVVFLTVDDGVVRDDDIVRWFAKSGVPAVAFIPDLVRRDHEPYFSRLRNAGVPIANHTLRHSWLRGRASAIQRREVCGAARSLARWSGSPAQAFRPPFGVYDKSLMSVAGRCGIRWIVLWSAEIRDGRLEARGARGLRAGDIVLLHFTNSMRSDLRLFVRESRRAGLEPAPLLPYLQNSTPDK